MSTTMEEVQEEIRKAAPEHYLVDQWGGIYADSRDEYAWMDLYNHLSVITLYLCGTGQKELAQLYSYASDQAAARVELIQHESEGKAA